MIDVHNLTVLPFFVHFPGKGIAGLRPSGLQMSPSPQSGRSLWCIG